MQLSERMRRALVATAAVATATAVASVGLARQEVGQSREPWQAGRCYRVFPEDREQLYIFKVLDPPSGGYVRVQTDPSAQRVPGARPQQPLWLSTAGMFAVQEWPCSD